VAKIGKNTQLSPQSMVFSVIEVPKVSALRGNSPATVDEKGRIKIPSGFRAALDLLSASAKADGRRFYLTSIDAKCARLYPLHVWEAIEERLSRLPSTLEARKKFLENTSYYGSEVEPDAQGRFVVQPILRAAANLTGEVVILGQMDHLVIWNRAAFEGRLSADPLGAAHLDQLAELGI
jgi:MraZ protein